MGKAQVRRWEFSVLDRQVALSSATVLSLINRRGAEPHNVLSGTRSWYGDEAVGEDGRRAHGELEGVGLFSNGAIDPGLLNTIDAVAHPTIEYYGWIAGGYEGRPLNYTLLVGLGAGEAFALGRNIDADAISIATIYPNELLENFVAQLPALPPGRGQQLSAPESEVTGDGNGDAGTGEVSIMRGNRPNPRDASANEIKRILSLSRLGTGTLYVATRTRAGMRRRCEKPVNYIDTEEGRWLTEKVPGPGEPLVVCTPATPQLFADRLTKAHSSLA